MSSQDTNQSPDKPIKQFVKSVVDQDYAAANQHLTTSINDKLKNKIEQLKNINIFKDK